MENAKRENCYSIENKLFQTKTIRHQRWNIMVNSLVEKTKKNIYEIIMLVLLSKIYRKQFLYIDHINKNNIYL